MTLMLKGSYLAHKVSFYNCNSKALREFKLWVFQFKVVFSARSTTYGKTLGMT